ncbi:hypothetical protein Hte_007994 [Hypoxylon texense]
MLNLFLNLHKSSRGKFSIRDAIAAAYINIVTAHDVVAITLRAVAYYLAKNPVIQKKLQKEISNAEELGHLSKPAKYSEITPLTYVRDEDEDEYVYRKAPAHQYCSSIPKRYLTYREEQFGAGARNCIGKNLAMMQLTKIIVELYRNFDIRLADPGKEWTVSGGWLTRQTEMDMILTKRN